MSFSIFCSRSFSRRFIPFLAGFDMLEIADIADHEMRLIVFSRGLQHNSTGLAQCLIWRDQQPSSIDLKKANIP